MEWQRDGPVLLFDSTKGVAQGMDGFNGGRKGLLVAMSKLVLNFGVN
jgi:hypothetical protein